MALVTLRDITLHQGHTTLLDHIHLTIEARERIALIGRNGMGKSTLMKLINQEVMPDGGELVYQNKVHIARLEQEVPQQTHGSIFAVIAEGLGEVGKNLAFYLEQTAKLDSLSDAQQNELYQLHIDWTAQSKVEKVLSLLDLSGEDDFSALSGGMKRRVLLGRALVQDPDLLLLDEPTNHLDIESILWLEKFLLNYPAALLFITHDRTILNTLATRIIELDRGILTSFPGNYETYLNQKDSLLETEARHNALFDKKLAQEEVWIRQGIKARRTRNEGRVRALERLREERSQRREKMGQVSLAVSMAERSGQLVLEAKNISYHAQHKPLIQDFSLTLHRGDKVGIIGPNGCGKSTLLKLLLKQQEPQAGSVRLGENLQIAYFDQLRQQLNPLQSVADNVMEGSTMIEINGESKHIISYLQDFLFAPERARGPVKVLSGGERNRLLLAKLFAKPSNMLIMDEPTNDLDAETLDLLEELLIDYKGTLIIVSHDRSFLNHVVTSTIAFEGKGVVHEYVGGYDDWQRQRRTPAFSKAGQSTKELPQTASPHTQKNAEQSTAPPPVQKINVSQQKALNTLEAEIELMEKEKSQLEQEVASPQFYTLSSETQNHTLKQVAALIQKLERALTEWEGLSQ